MILRWSPHHSPKDSTALLATDDDDVRPLVRTQKVAFDRADSIASRAFIPNGSPENIDRASVVFLLDAVDYD